MSGAGSTAGNPPWADWIGRETVAEDTFDVERARALHATLDRPGAPPAEGEPLPPLWHWIYFWSADPTSTLGPDGLRTGDGGLPPIDLPRRMWGSSYFRFRRPLPVGARITRRTRIVSIEEKQGRSGRLAFVRISKAYTAGDADKPALEEDFDLVYREAARPGEVPPPGDPAPDGPPWQHTVDPHPALLFRYSALTFNSHRIHYDLPYVTQEEGYPGLLVHGPLLALMMMELAVRESGRLPTRYEFRAMRAVFATAPFTVAGAPHANGDGATVWTIDGVGQLAMRGRMRFS